MVEWITANWGLITSVGTFAGPTITWVLSKRHFQKKELEVKDADIMQKNLQIYQDMLDDVVKRKEMETTHLEQKIDALNAEVQKLREVIKALTTNGSELN